MKLLHILLFIFAIAFYSCQKEVDIPDDPEANSTLFTKYLGHSWEWDDFTGNTLIKTPDGGYVVAYHDWDPLNDTGDLTKRQDIRLVKYSFNRDIVWNEAYTSKYVNFAYAVDNTIDNGYIIAGAKAKNFQWYGYSKMYLIKTDKDGNKLWDKTYGSDFNGQAIGVSQNRIGDYYVLGNHTQDRTSILMKVNSQGDSLWALSAADATLPPLGFQDILATSDNGFMAVANSVVKGNPEGKIDWIYEGDHFLTSQTFVQFYSAKEMADGYVLFGNLRRRNSSTNKSDFLLVKLTKNGEMDWFKTYDIGSYDDGNHVSLVTDGGFMISGNKEENSTSRMFFMKVDAEGNELWKREYNYSMFNANQGLSAYHLIDDQYILLGVTGNAHPRYDELILAKIRASE